MKKPFNISPYAFGDKQLEICGPCDLIIYVDFDDVDHESVLADAKRLADILNNNWETA